MFNADWSKITWPLITFSFDDGYDTHYTNGLPLFSSKGEVACSNIITGFIGQALMMTWDQVRALQAAGWEICSHSRTHNYSILENPDYFAQEYLGSMQDMVAQGIVCSNYVYPGGGFNQAVFNYMKPLYHSGRGLDYRTNMCPVSAPLNLGAYNYVLYDLAGFQALIQANMFRGAWIIIYSHGISNIPGGDVDILTSWIDWMHTQGLKCYTTQQAIDIGGVITYE